MQKAHTATIETSALIKNLIGAAVSGSPSRYAALYRELYARGTTITNDLDAHLLGQNYAALTTRSIRAFTPVFQLLYELDQSQAAATAETLSAKHKNKLLDSEIRRIQSQKAGSYATSESCGVKIFVSKQLAHPAFIERKVHRWLKLIPEDHLAFLETAFIVPTAECGLDRGGYYEFDFGRIVVGWHQEFSPNHMAAILFGDILLSQIFFHEVGHHVLGHKGGPVDPRKEAAADAFMFRMLIENSRFLRILLALWNMIFAVYRAVRSKDWTKELAAHWVKGSVALNPGAAESEVQSFEQKYERHLSNDLKRAIKAANGFAEKQVCPEGFYFYPIEKFDIRTVRHSDFERMVIFAKHLPTGTEYGMPLGENAISKTVFRSACNTASGYVQASRTFANFVRQYVLNSAILTS